MNLYDYQKRNIKDLPEIFDNPTEIHIEAFDEITKQMLFSVTEDSTTTYFRTAVPKTSAWNDISTDMDVTVQRISYQGTGQNAHITYGRLTIQSIPEQKTKYENVNAEPTQLTQEDIVSQKAKLELELAEAIVSLNEGQKMAYEGILEGYRDNKSLFYITGSPGVGKSFLSETLKLFFQTEEESIEAIAPSHKAKAVLSEAMGMDATTTARYCGFTLEESDDPTTGDDGQFIQVRESSECDVAFIDEVSMCSNEHFKIIKDSANIVIAMGDKNQLEAIKTDNADLSKAITFELTEPMRQNNTDSALYKNIQILKRRLDNEAPMVPELFTFDETFKETEDGLIDDYVNGKIDVIVAYRNVFVDAYNEAIQKKLTGDTKIIEGNDLILNKPLNSMTPVQIGRRQVYPILRNNGDNVNVVHIHETQPEIGTIVDLDIQDPQPARLLLSREQFSTKSFVWELWLQYWKPIMQWKQFKRFCVNASLPYAVSTHKVQGSTYENVGINLGDLQNTWTSEEAWRLQYVAISRCKHTCYVKL